MTQMSPETKLPNLAWMTGWCGAIGLCGIILVGSVFEATSSPVRMLFDVLHPAEKLDLNSDMRFSLAILGAVTIGWSLTLLTVIQVANQLEKSANRSIWLGLTATILIWYAIDSILSIVTGFWLNAVSNTIFSATFLIPVIRSGVLRG